MGYGPRLRGRADFIVAPQAKLPENLLVIAGHLAAFCRTATGTVAAQPECDTADGISSGNLGYTDVIPRTPGTPPATQLRKGVDTHDGRRDALRGRHYAQSIPFADRR